MPDHAISDDRAVQAQLDRLWSLSPGADLLGLERITRLLARLGDPQHALPPVFHVAGTNGKGSTCAYLRAALEAAGHRVHVYASPHLVRFNERIRLAGRLIDDPMLAALLAEVLDQADGIGASFFEVTTAAAFLAFARTPAAATIVEVGLGGRLDATNVIARPAVTGIAALGLDHQAFLGDTLTAIAGEKAGIARRDVPLVTMRYPPAIAARVAAVADARGARLVVQDRDWSIGTAGAGLVYRDGSGPLVVSPPKLPGAFQADNLGLALAMLRHQGAVPIPAAALALAGPHARWPARLQRLGRGPLTAPLEDAMVLLDGAHNPSAAVAVAAGWGAIDPTPRRALILGLLANKDADGVLAALVPQAARIVTVPVPGHASHDPAVLADRARALGGAAQPAASVEAAVAIVAARAPSSLLIAGSLYLAGLVLEANGELPD